jgi:hypothetical protein
VRDDRGGDGESMVAVVTAARGTGGLSSRTAAVMVRSLGRAGSNAERGERGEVEALGLGALCGRLRFVQA